MNRNMIIAITVIVAAVLLSFGAWYFLGPGPVFASESASVIIGERPYEANALFYIAEDQGFFTENGLNVTMRSYPSVPYALNALVNGEVDIGLGSEYAVAGKILDDEHLRIAGSIARFETMFLMGRRDRGIENISDLKGKRIGLTRNAIGEFYLGRFLDLNGLSIQDVTLVNTPPTQQLQALTNGSVDALVAGTNIDTIKEQFGSSLAIWSVQNSQNGFIVVAGRDEYVAGHPEEIKRLLKSLVQAEKYAIDHPEEAEKIVQERLNYTDDYMAEVWPEHRFSVSLEQSLLIAMNDEARWMMANNLTNATKIPDFRNSIVTEGLRDVRPDVVTIR
jgi:NitT/TauT family transport system substrate-binding protein